MKATTFKNNTPTTCKHTCANCQSHISYDYVRCDGSYDTEHLCKYYGDCYLGDPNRNICSNFHALTNIKYTTIKDEDLPF